MPRSFLALIGLFACNVLFAQNKLEKDLNAYFKKKEKSNVIHASFGIVKDSFHYATTVGFKNGYKIKADSATCYAIGSLTKTYTAVLILKLVEDGKLELNEKLRKYYPNMPFAGEITISSMLNHQSKIEDQHYFDWKYRDKKFKLGKKGVYSNVNYGLLGEIIEKASGKSYAEYLQEHIILPLNLDHTFYGIDSTQNIDLAEGHYFKSGEWSKTDHRALMDAGGAGGIIATVGDLQIFIDALFNEKLINKQSLSLMTKYIDGMGMGLFPAQYISMKGYTNSGQFGPYQSTFVYFPKEKTSIIILSNGTLSGMNGMLKEIMIIMFQ